MFYRTLGTVKVNQKLPPQPNAGDTFFDEDTGAFFIFYGEGAGWLQVSREDLTYQDGC